MEQLLYAAENFGIPFTLEYTGDEWRVSIQGNEYAGMLAEVEDELRIVLSWV